MIQEPPHPLRDSPLAAKTKEQSWTRHIRNNPGLYAMLVPGIVYFLVFRYIPLAGSVIAFQNYNIFQGIWESEWVGFQWFEQMFLFANFKRLLVNTLVISLYQLVFTFPAPIILACMLNEFNRARVKRWMQTILYLPHFLSWTIIFALVYALLSSQSGLVNHYLTQLGMEPIPFLQKADYFRTMVISTGMWKEMGWGTIIYLAALAGINPSLYEAATVDGANRWKQFLHITVPGLLPATMILLLLKIGHILDIGFEQIYVFLNPANYSVGDVIDTYAYRSGLLNGQYSFATAIGLFKSIVGFLLLLIANRISKSTTGEGLY
ncbi:ABC transporter permease [Paenibacillus hodogayensis]|uniref:ABC transporter permease n=1 Tax=Paenibacillus hodogayensis TaxID=279208 RepID=A0ABV5W7U8_9BACL